MNISAEKLCASALMHGRTLLSGGTLWFNWTASGFTLSFTGTSLRAKMRVMPDRAFAFAGPGDAFDYPCVCVLADGGSEPLFRQKLTEDGQWYTLFEGSDGEHTVRVVRMSENNKGKAGIEELELDGALLAPPEGKTRRIELVGDSITCGYGNETDKAGFRTEDENALCTYGYLAAGELDAEYSCVAVSGCSVASPTWLPGIDEFHAMETLYAYTDKPVEKALGADGLTKWDFGARHNDAVVINLGTNDANEVKMLGFTDAAVDSFHGHYGALIEQIRALNGPDTWIICTLGSMDYYLWDDIRDTVQAYCGRTGDARVVCKKLGATVNFTEGSGADTHPSAATHKRMGRELAAILRKCLEG